MRLVRLAVLAALVGVVCLAGDSALARDKVNKKKHHTFHGVVVHVHHGKEKHHGRITVKEHRHDRERTLIEKTFHVDAKTTFEVVEESKKGKKAHKTNFRHVHKGQHVIVHHHGEHATDVKIVRHHKK